MKILFEVGFPKELLHDVLYVSDYICSTVKPHKLRREQTKHLRSWTLQNGERVVFPYRIYLSENSASLQNPTQQFIYHCIFTRSCNGFVREKHIRHLISSEFPDWVIPYVVTVCEEYVVQILAVVHHALRDKNTGNIKDFCAKNLERFLLGHDRMISYWNEYYRGKYPKFENYVGCRLYADHFGYRHLTERRRSHWRWENEC